MGERKMKEIIPITEDEFNNIVAQTGFTYALMLKDYYITIILYLLKDVKGIYFKGETALNKIFLEYARISEDVDYSVSKDLKIVEKEIREIIKECPFFHSVTHDKRVNKFTRLIAHYKGFDNEESTVFIDLNEKADLVLKPEEHKIPHHYPENVPLFSVTTLAKKEMMAEKVAATIGRNKPRDHFDVYMILKHKQPLDLKLVKKKCENSGNEFNIIKMFNKAKKLKNRWDEDMAPLLANNITFQEIMQTLAKHFDLKKEKDKLKS
ncbi:hypothetical protein CL616_03065 [archaeon]|nr:hypothetical protein [archaeon]